MLPKSFVKLLLAQRAGYYLNVYAYLYSQSDDDGKVAVPHKLISAWFDVQRTTLLRVMQLGVTHNVCEYRIDKGSLSVSFYQQKEIVTKVKAKQKATIVDPLYAPMMTRYKEWIMETTQISFTPAQVDNAALNALIKKLREGQKQKGHLTTEADVNDAVMNSFDVLLKLWHLQPAFYQTQVKLTQMNSNLVVLIQNLKANYGKTKQNRASAFARAEANLNFSGGADAAPAGAGSGEIGAVE